MAELRDASLVPANTCDSQGTRVARGYGDGTFGTTDPGAPAQHAADIGTYIANAGAIPDAPTTQAGWDAPASRAWVALVLYQALQNAP